MKNWAGNVTFTPKKIHAPATVAELQDVVRNTTGHLRMRGSGHSWTELIASNEEYVHLDELQGIVSVDRGTNQIRAKAGTKLYRLCEDAFAQGLALPNQGDINKQSIAGATSTGTHGTGVSLQSVANVIKGVTVVDGHGELREISDGDPRLKGLALTLGSCGVLAELNLQLIPAYKLKVETFPEDLSLSLQKLSQRLKANRHYEMFYFPVGDWSMVKTMNLTDEAPTKRSFAHTFNDVVLENWLYEGINVLATKTRGYRALDKFMRKFVSHNTKVDWSHRAFPTERSVKFMEMEFNVPAEKFDVVLDELKHTIKKHKFQTLFPIEIRWVAKDDLWLSPAQGRDSVYFAVHTYITEEYRDYFKACQDVFTRHQGRPHWGKWHSLTAAYFREAYPRFDDFLKLRNDFDPQGRFLNPHLRDVFGL